MKTITRAKGRTKEHEVEVQHIIIPDLWHIAISLPEPEQAQVLEAWHLAHDLLNHLREEDGTP